jgi:O-methyltransferase involved in polyketide biosynthesis
VDREAGEQFRAVFPEIVEVARSSRQFLDIGTGLPTADNTHEVAQRVVPDARVVYVDNDPVVLAHARALLTSSTEGATGYIDADLRDPDRILDLSARTLDLSRPVALMLLGVLGHLDDDDQARSVAQRLLDGLASGSYLVLCDGTDTSQAGVQAQQDYDQSGAVPYRLRSPEQIAGFFEGLELVEPGRGVLPPLAARRRRPASRD